MKSTMDSTPLFPRSEARPIGKSASCLLESSADVGENVPPKTLTLSQSKKLPSSLNLSPQSYNPLPLPHQEPLLLSPFSLRRSKARLVDAGKEPAEQVGSSRKRRIKAISAGLMGCASSPKNRRRAKRTLEPENREERDPGLGEENVKVRKKRESRRGVSRKEKMGSVPLIPSPSPSPKSDNEDSSSMESVQQMIYELIMWKDIAKSSLWFGFGSLCFLSSCFAGGFSFSVIRAISQLGLLFLAKAFFYNSFNKRHKDDRIPEFELKEDDIVRATRVILPAANAAIAVTRELFSGEPSMTLKMVPIFLFVAEYGHLITPWRFFATGFFFSFTVPKLYSSHSCQMQRRVEHLRNFMLNAWEACSHKRIVATSAATAFWNLSTFRMRIFAAFISVVVLQYYRQPSLAVAEVGWDEGKKQQMEVVAEHSTEGSNKDQL